MKRRLVCILAVLLAGAGMVFAQANSTINGRVVDPADAVVPNAAVTITNLATGVARDSVTNSEGLYSIPALTPGNYSVKVSAQGFSAAERANVELLTAATLSVDFKMSVGAVQQSVEVGAQAALVETSQATQGSSIRQAEVMGLPMINRSMATLMTMLPGAREMDQRTPEHGASANVISIGGGGGRNFNMQVDGIDNKEDTCGGTMVPYSLEGIQEFKIFTTGANAEFGRGTANALVSTKSGSNAIHGTGFFYFRNQDLIHTDYFSEPSRGGLGKPPLSRYQYGGSVGGPIIKDKMFYFGSVERTQQDFFAIRNQTFIQQLSYLLPLNIGLKIGNSIPQPNRDLLYVAKVNYNFSAKNSAFLRFAGETGYLLNDSTGPNTGLPDWAPQQVKDNQLVYTGTLGETFVINPTTVNQFSTQWMNFKHDSNFANCPITTPGLGINSCLPRALAFPTVTSMSIPTSDLTTWEHSFQFKDDLSKQMGRHGLKFGGDYSYIPVLGGIVTRGPGTVSFFADPQTIATNVGGLYPQGFQTPGIIRQITEYNNAFGYYGGGGGDSHSYKVAFYGQDDYKMTPRVTLNAGLRWEQYNNTFLTPEERALNPVFQILQTIGSPYGQQPKLPNHKNFEPRLGVAWDVGGNGKNVVRVSAGLYYIQQVQHATFQQDVAEKPRLSFPTIVADSVFGQPGPLANFVYGVTPFPAIVTNTTFFPVGGRSGENWYDPNNLKDARTQQYHAGWSHVFADGKDVVSVDFTYMILQRGWRTLDINPLLPDPANPTGPFVRPLSAATLKFYNDPNLLGTVNVVTAVGNASYKETAVHLEHRFNAKSSFQINYVLAWSYGQTGNSDGATPINGVQGAPPPQIASATGGLYNAPWEWGPTGVDERNRITATGIFNLPFKIDLTPSVTWATARPYTIYAKPCTCGDGSSEPLNAAGNPIGWGTQRGSALFMLNTRATRNFVFGRDGRFNVAAFVEMYNITNRANFGNNYGQNQFAPTTFEKPITYLGGAGAVPTLPNAFQAQFGGRFTF